MCSYIICLCYLFAGSVIVPSYYSYSRFGVLQWNGSSPTGHCSDFTRNDLTATCNSPNSSVLFDGNIPTLTGLDSSSWASQLLILQTTSRAGNFVLKFGFPNFVLFNIQRVEIVVMHCPEWGLSAARGVKLSKYSPFTYTFDIETVFYTVGSDVPCGSLMKICMSVNVSRHYNINQYHEDPKELHVTFDNSMYWVHLAEVTFFDTDSPCQDFTIVPVDGRGNGMNDANILVLQGVVALP